MLRLPAARASFRRHALRLAPARRGLALGAACVAAVPLVYWGARTGPFFVVRAIEVDGAPPALAREVRAALEPVRGRSLLALDGDDVIARVEALPQVADASYDRAFPQALVVRVRRELGRAVLRRGQSSWLLSGRGRVIRPVPRGTHMRLPRVWIAGSVPVRVGAVVADEAVLRSVAALGFLRDERLPVPVHAVDAQEQLAFRLARGIELRLGEATDLALKLAVAARVIGAIPPRLHGQQVFLDVSVPARPVVGPNSRVEE